MSDVLNHYCTHKYPRARRAAQMAVLGLKSEIKHPTVEDLTLTNQRMIWRHMHECELSLKSIAIYMGAVRSAILFSARPQIVPNLEGQEEEVQLLSATIPIICNKHEIAEHLGVDAANKKRYMPTIQELAKWLDSIVEEDDWRYAVIALNTWARNEAIFQLRVGDQIDFETGLVDLNPPGRKQTKKRRPIIRLTNNLKGWLMEWDEQRPIRQYQDTVEKRLNLIGKRIGLPELTCYSIRHFMASKSRNTSHNVTREQRSQWLGHIVSEGSSTTEWYEHFDADYLEAVMHATDEIILQINTHMRVKSLLAPTQHPQSGLLVINGNG